jgi:hypothetical protein
VAAELAGVEKATPGGLAGALVVPVQREKDVAALLELAPSGGHHGVEPRRPGGRHRAPEPDGAGGGRSDRRTGSQDADDDEQGSGRGEVRANTGVTTEHHDTRVCRDPADRDEVDREDDMADADQEDADREEIDREDVMENADQEDADREHADREDADDDEDAHPAEHAGREQDREDTPGSDDAAPGDDARTDEASAPDRSGRILWSKGAYGPPAPGFVVTRGKAGVAVRRIDSSTVLAALGGLHGDRTRGASRS